MSKQDGGNPQPIQAVDFDAPGQLETRHPHSVTDKAEKSPWWHSQFNLMLSVFALLAIAVVVFILVVPKPSIDHIVESNESIKTIKAKEQAPWSDARKTQARSESQAILSKLLNIKEELENKQVELWAANRYQTALENADQGDEFYKQQQYEQAISSYQTALTEMEVLLTLLPDIIKTKLTEGEQAIEQGKSQLAKQIFTELLKFDEQNTQAQTGLERANKLEQAFVYIESAQEYERSFKQSRQLTDLQAAEKQYQQALAIDAKLTKAIQGKQRVEQAIIDKRFQIAMSQGFAAMSNRNYPVAKNGFSEALKIKPDEKIAASSYQQALAADQSSSLSRLITDAKVFEKNENWQNALSHYQLVLQRDNNQVQAKLGVLRVTARNTLDAQLVSILADTLELSKKAVRQDAEKRLAEAKAIKQPGSRLEQQIRQLETSLKQMTSPVKVQFFSDAITEVSLLKVGANKIQLGQFSEKSLSLKPGRYVATGFRVGFRDVRKELELYPGSDSIQTFTIQCNELISNGG